MFIEKLNEVLASKKSFISDGLNSSSLMIAGLLNIIHWVMLIIKIKPSADENILLHYNVVIGADLVGKSIFIYLIPLTALMLLGANTFIAANFYQKEKLASYFLNIASIAVQAVFLAASIVLVVANAQ